MKKSSTSRPGLQVLWPVVTFLANGPCEAKEYSVTAAWASYLKGPVSDDYWWLMVINMIYIGKHDLHDDYYDDDLHDDWYINGGSYRETVGWLMVINGD